jgi:hypothetical protein
MSPTVAALAVSLVTLVGLSGCSKKSPTAPVDPNASMYGTWNGTDMETTPGPIVTPYGITIVLAKGSVAFYSGGAQYPAAIFSMSDPNVVFDVTNGPNSVRFTATRAGTTMNGGGTWTSGAIDGWAVTKASPQTVPFGSTRPRDPFFGAGGLKTGGAR